MPVVQLAGLEHVVDEDGIAHVRVPGMAQLYGLCETRPQLQTILSNLTFRYDDGTVTTCLFCLALEIS